MKAHRALPLTIPGHRRKRRFAKQPAQLPHKDGETEAAAALLGHGPGLQAHSGRGGG